MTGHHDRLEGRNRDIWRDSVVGGLNQYELAEKYDLAQSRISNILKEVRESITATPREEWLAQEIGHVQEIRNKLAGYLDRPGLPVTAGKDGDLVRDPSDAQPVRSYAEHAQIARTALAYTERLGKMLGLDAAVKSVVETPDLKHAGDALAAQAAERLLRAQMNEDQSDA